MSPTFDREILGRLADLTPDEITAALAAIRAEGESLKGQDPTATVVEQAKSLADAARQLTGELSRRTEAAESFKTDMAALNELTAPAPVEPEKPAETAPATEGETALTEDKPAEDAADDKADADGDTETAEEAEKDEDEAVTAAAKRPLGSNNTGRAGGLVRTLPKVAVQTTAAVGLKDHSPGDSLTEEQFLKAFHNKIRATSSLPAGSSGDRWTVATLRSEYPEDRYLTASAGAFENLDKIDKVVREAQKLTASDNLGALTAAGLCAPLEVLYDIETIGDIDRPVRDALVRFGVERGGITYRSAIDGVTQTGGIGTWTATNDTASPLVPKTCLEVACPGLTDAEVAAIYMCLQFSNMATKFDPEHMRAVQQAQLVAHARYAENRLLTQLTTGSKAVFSTQILGATRDSLSVLDHMIAYIRNVHRIADEVPLRLIAPLWYKYQLRADITFQMVGDGLQSLAVTDQQIASWFAARNINVTFHLDGIDPADITEPTPDVVVPAQFYTTLATGSPVPPFPAAVSTLLFREGDWLFLDGGTLDMGTVRDSSLNSNNRFQTFSESFEGTAFRGIESFQLVMPLKPTGASAATVSTAAAA